MLVGSRVVLREYVASDSAGIYKWRNDAQTTQWLGRRYRAQATLQEVEESLQKVIIQPSQNAVYYAIADKGALGYIGGIDLTDIDWTDRNAVLSIVVGDAKDRDKGYGSEAIQLLLRYAFLERGLHRVSLNVSEGNNSAVRCYIKNGFRIEGRKREHELVHGKYRDLLQMGILESEYHPES